MLVMPRVWEQPDNAARAALLDIARVLAPRRYSPSRVAGELRHPLEEEHGQRALAVRDQIGPEDGVGAACDAIAAFLAR
jgi:UDP:flavonoid glycosyltransferase YjiC (YdhE family)